MDEMGKVVEVFQLHYDFAKFAHNMDNYTDNSFSTDFASSQFLTAVTQILDCHISRGSKNPKKSILLQIMQKTQSLLESSSFRWFTVK